jgi:hypothetical protein
MLGVSPSCQQQHLPHVLDDHCVSPGLAVHLKHKRQIDSFEPSATSLTVAAAPHQHRHRVSRCVVMHHYVQPVEGLQRLSSSVLAAQ